MTRLPLAASQPPSRLSSRLAGPAALIGPSAVAALLVPVRHQLSGADLALVLVAAVVATASSGQRLTGWGASVLAGVCFDLLLAPPYGSFSIASKADLTTLVLLVAVGAGVTELAHWGRREHGLARQRADYLAGLCAASDALAAGGSPTQLANRAAELITEVLELRRCHFRFDTDPSAPLLQSDGTVRWGDVLWDVEGSGFPLNHQTELPVISAGRRYGRFLLTAAPNRPPTLLQRRVAISLAAQVGAALSDFQSLGE
jgi:hypothetical protein